MASNPFSYDSLKCVFQYMEPNKRFQVAHHCPSTRTAERATPLKIDHLKFSNGEIQVNKTTYRIGICRKYTRGEAPKSIECENKKGGVQHEVDRFGVEDRSDEATLTLGDIKIASSKLFPGFGAAPEKDLEQMITELKHEIREHTSRMSGRGSEFEHFDREQLLRIRLFALECKRDNVTPPYENYLQLTIYYSMEQKTVERYVHNKKHSEAMKQLGEYIFGGRQVPVQVRQLQMVGLRPVLRLPLGIKFAIHELNFPSKVGVTLDALSPIIHESSYPFKQLGIGAYEEQDVTHQVVQEAQILRINIHPIFPVLIKISNKVVHIYNTDSALFSVSFVIDLINNWIARRQEVGTTFSFFRGLEAKSMEEIKNRYDGAIILDGVLHIPMRYNTEIRVENTQIAQFWRNDRAAAIISVNASDN